MNQASSFKEFAEKYYEIVKLEQEPNLVVSAIKKFKSKAVRRKIGRFVRRQWINKDKVCFVVTSREIGFFKV